MGFKRSLLILPLLVIAHTTTAERLPVTRTHQLNATPALLNAEDIKDVHQDEHIKETVTKPSNISPPTTATTAANDGIAEGRSSSNDNFNLKPNTHYVISSTDLQILLNQIDARTKSSQPTIIVINTPAPQIIYQSPIVDPYTGQSYVTSSIHPDGLTHPDDLRQDFSIRKSNRDILRKRKQRRKVAAFYKRRGNILRRQHRIKAQNRRRRAQARRKNSRLQSNYLIQRRKIKHLNNAERARLKRLQAGIYAYNRQVQLQG